MSAKDELRYKIAYEIQKMRSYNETAEAILALAGKEAVKVVKKEQAKPTNTPEHIAATQRVHAALRELFGMGESE